MATRTKKVINEVSTEDNEVQFIENEVGNEVLEGNLDVGSSDIHSKSTTGPTPMVAGSFALYEMKDGGMHLVYRLIDSNEDVHQTFPAFVVKMAMQAAEGKGPLGHLNKMLGR